MLVWKMYLNHFPEMIPYLTDKPDYYENLAVDRKTTKVLQISTWVG